jgi:hypothetical protein
MTRVEKLSAALIAAAASNPPVQKRPDQWAEEYDVHPVTVYREIARLEIDQIRPPRIAKGTGVLHAFQNKGNRGPELRIGAPILRAAGLKAGEVKYRVDGDKLILERQEAK